MRNSDAILLDLVAAEEAGLQHHEGCAACQDDSRGKCEIGIQLAIEAVELHLEAKIWSDRRVRADVIPLRTGSDDGPGLSIVHRTT